MVVCWCRAAPKLKDVSVDSSEARRLYTQCIELMRTMYHSCHLIHADLSEFNLLWDDYVIGRIRPTSAASQMASLELLTWWGSLGMASLELLTWWGSLGMKDNDWQADSDWQMRQSWDERQWLWLTDQIRRPHNNLAYVTVQNQSPVGWWCLLYVWMCWG